MQVVDVDDPGRGEVGPDLGEVELGRRGLQQDPHRLPQSRQVRGRIQTPSAAPTSGSTHVQPKRWRSTAARMTPTEPIVSARTSS